MFVYILCVIGGITVGCMLSLFNVRRLKKRIKTLRDNSEKAVLLDRKSVV